MTNPFHLRWLQGWVFQVVLTGGKAKVEAYGFGICLRTSLLQGESPVSAADRLVVSEDIRRKSLHNAWSQGQNLREPQMNVEDSLKIFLQEKYESLVAVEDKPRIPLSKVQNQLVSVN